MIISIKKILERLLKRISQIDLISTVNDHLVYVNSRYNRKISNLAVDLDPVTKDLNMNTQKLDELKNKKKIKN